MSELFLLSLSKWLVWEFSAFHINGIGKLVLHCRRSCFLCPLVIAVDSSG